MAVAAIRDLRGGPTWLQRNRMIVTPILFLCCPGLLFFGLYVIIPILPILQHLALSLGRGLGEATYIGLATTKSF